MGNLRKKFDVSPSETLSFCHHNSRQEQQDSSVTGPRKYWEVSAHCETMQMPQLRPEIIFDNPASNYHYLRYSTNGVPDQQTVKLVTQAHWLVLGRLNQSQHQVRNFILPVYLMKMRHMDPISRQKVIEELCKYFSFQVGLRNIVMEQAELKFQDMCRIMVAIATASKVKSLFLWHVLDRCDKPFVGPLQSDIILDDLPRIPYTYNPGGRKYLRDLENNPQPQQIYSVTSKLILGNIGIKKSQMKSISETSETSPVTKDDSKDIFKSIGKLEDFVIKCLTDSTDDMTCKMIKKKLVHSGVPEPEDHVFSQAEVGIQCTISQDHDEKLISKDPSRANRISVNESKFEMQTDESQALKIIRLQFCEEYLKYHEHTKLDFGVLKEIYMIALSGLTYLTELAVNYCMLADGTGNVLMSIGSIAGGKLKLLKLLCEPDDTPSPNHQLYHDRALHTIPDLIWHSVEKKCPDLRVHIVCVSMSAYAVTSRFVTKTMPLVGFTMENGFCPTLASRQLTIFCTLKCLWLDHCKTLEHVNITLLHTTGILDSSLEKLIQNSQLRSFVYHGPLQRKDTINKLCNAALNSTEMQTFKLLIQGDPCYPHIARELTSTLYNEYKYRFQDKNINFVLGTLGSKK